MSGSISGVWLCISVPSPGLVVWCQICIQLYAWDLGSLWVCLYVLGSCVGSVCSSGSRVWCKKSGIWHSGSTVYFWVWCPGSEVQSGSEVWCLSTNGHCFQFNTNRSFHVGAQWRRKLYSMQIAQLWYSMAIRTAQLLRRSVWLQVKYEVAQLWNSSRVLLLNCEAAWLLSPWGKVFLGNCRSG